MTGRTLSLMTGDQWAIVANSAAIVVNVWWTIRLARALREVGHGAGGCGGLPARCAACIRLYHSVVGREVVPRCAACGADHWPYDPHQWPPGAPTPQ